MNSLPKPDPTPTAPRSDVALWIEHVKSLGPVVVTMVVISLLVPAILGIVLITQASLNPTAPEGLIAQWGVPLAAVVAAALIAITTGSAILPTYALSFACGVYFGPGVGSATALVGIVGGALVGYAWGALLARNRVMQVIDANPKASAIRASLVDRGLRDELLAVTLIRVPPNSPFAIGNLVMSASGVRILPYILGTAIGITPRTVAAVVIGAAVGAMRSTGMREKVIGLVVAAVVIFILYRLFSAWAQEGLARARAAGNVPEAIPPDPR